MYNNTNRNNAGLSGDSNDLCAAGVPPLARASFLRRRRNASAPYAHTVSQSYSGLNRAHATCTARVSRCPEHVSVAWCGKRWHIARYIP